MYITEDEFKTLDHTKLNDVLERLHNKTIEDTLKLLPEIIVGLVVRTKGIKDAYKDFMDKHKEFEGRDAELAKVVQELELEDGSRSLGEILQMVPARMQVFDIPKDQPQTPRELERTANGFL